jgi:glycosyltransferase involved in cell wall biosynthesis
MFLIFVSFFSLHLKYTKGFLVWQISLYFQQKIDLYGEICINYNMQFINGKVVSGQQYGRKIGYPTANLIMKYLEIPLGVWVTKALYNNQWYDSISYFSKNSINEKIFETHFFNFERQIYDENIEVKLIQFLREPIHFDTQDELIKQMQNDCNKTKQILEKLPESKKLTLHIIAKNEQEILYQGLGSIAPFVDNIVFVDTGSTDKTIEIAKKFTSDIHHFEWRDDFSAARNYIDSLITDSEYILRWDADWVLTPESINNFLTLKNNNFEDLDKVYFTWNFNFVNDQPTQKSKYYFIYKSKTFKWISPIHNTLVPIDKTRIIAEKYFQSIEVNHLKEPKEKSWRYLQTLKILDATVPNAPVEVQKHLINFYCESLIQFERYESAIFWTNRGLELEKDDVRKQSYLVELGFRANLATGLIEEAIKLVEKYKSKLESDPNFMLVLADLKAVKNEKDAKEIYQRFLDLNLTPEDFDGYWDKSRFEDHPKNMINKLS